MSTHSKIWKKNDDSERRKSSNERESKIDNWVHDDGDDECDDDNDRDGDRTYMNMTRRRRSE